MSYGPYPQYKDSGVEWLGKVPEHWRTKPIWTLFTRTKRTGYPDEMLLSVYRDYGVVPTASRDDNHNRPSEDLSGYQLVEQSDLAINKMKAWQGSVAISNHRGIVSPAYHIYKAHHEEDPRYLHHLFRCNEYISGYLANSKGIRVNQWDLEPQQHSRMQVLLPSVSEQTQIARFLDHETGKIDGLIAEQEKLIGLLKEKRQALALQAYLDSDSIESRLENAVDVIARPVQYESEREYVALGIYNRGRGLFHKEPKLQEELGDSDFFVIEEGDLILSGQFAWEGSVALASSSETGTIVSHRYPVIRGKSHICFTEYVFALLTTPEGDFLLNECSRGAAGRNRPLNIGALLKEKIKIPNMALQHKIVSFVHEEKKLLVEIRATIKLLEERRSALISSVVTGKIDVRNWKPQGDAA